MEMLDQILSEKPSFHRGETEIERAFDPSESLLPRTEAQRLAANSLDCYGISDEILSLGKVSSQSPRSRWRICCSSV
jgi:hypothetical protein